MNTPVREGETIEGSRTTRIRPYPVLKCSRRKWCDYGQCRALRDPLRNTVARLGSSTTMPKRHTMAGTTHRRKAHACSLAAAASPWAPESDRGRAALVAANPSGAAPRARASLVDAAFGMRKRSRKPVPWMWLSPDDGAHALAMQPHFEASPRFLWRAGAASEDQRGGVSRD